MNYTTNCVIYHVNCRHAAELIRLYRGCLDLTVTDYLSLLVSLVRAWSSLVSLWLIPDTLTKLPSSCLPSLTQSRVYRLRAWSILANLERLVSIGTFLLTHSYQGTLMLDWATSRRCWASSPFHVIAVLPRDNHWPSLVSLGKWVLQQAFT